MHSISGVTSCGIIGNRDSERQADVISKKSCRHCRSSHLLSVSGSSLAGQCLQCRIVRAPHPPIEEGSGLLLSWEIMVSHRGLRNQLDVDIGE